MKADLNVRSFCMVMFLIIIIIKMIIYSFFIKLINNYDR